MTLIILNPVSINRLNMGNVVDDIGGVLIR